MYALTLRFLKDRKVLDGLLQFKRCCVDKIYYIWIYCFERRFNIYKQYKKNSIEYYKSKII